MNFAQAIIEVKKAAAAGLPVLLVGSPGIGKTTVAAMLAIELDLPYREVRPAEFEAVDFRGIPMIIDGKTKWMVPDFWPTVPCVLNVDEITQAPMELTSPLLKLFLGGAIGDYTLPAGTVLMATGNLASDRAGCSRLSSALRERCIVIHLEPDYQGWRKWYQAQPDCDAGLLAFLDQNPALFSQWDAKNDWNQPTPRNWSRVSRLLPFDPAEETVAGIVGKDVAAALMKWRRANVSLPSVLEVYSQRKSLPSSPAQMAKFVETLADYAVAAPSSNEADIAFTVANSLGADCWEVQLLKLLAKRNPAMLKQSTWRKLVAKHAAAIVATR